MRNSCNKNARTSIQEQRRTSGLPCAMALRLIRGRPGDRLCLSPSPCEALASSRLDVSTGTSGPHDFTVRNSPFVFVLLRPPLPAPRLRRWPTPLWRDRMAGVIKMICPTVQQEYFSARDWTGFCNRQVICPSGCFVAAAARRLRLHGTRNSPRFIRLELRCQCTRRMG